MDKDKDVDLEQKGMGGVGKGGSEEEDDDAREKKTFPPTHNPHFHFSETPHPFFPFPPLSVFPLSGPLFQSSTQRSHFWRTKLPFGQECNFLFPPPQQ